MPTPEYFMAYSPSDNITWQINERDADSIAKYASAGVDIFAVFADGSRERIEPGSIKAVSRVEEAVTLVQPIYVDDRMSAVVDVFDALQALMLPEASALSDDGAMATARAARDPMEVFREKLTALRKIAKVDDH